MKCFDGFRVKKKQGHEQDFLTVGAMGHASLIALSIALNRPGKQVSDKVLEFFVIVISTL
jgi:hypothetical protein